MEVEEREIPAQIRGPGVGRRTMLVHIATNDTWCYPDADNEADRSATVEIDEYYEEDCRTCQ
jgi:hypothetical protein